MRKVLWVGFALLAVVLACAIYVGVKVASELRPARSVLVGSDDATSQEISTAARHIRAALDVLDDPPARLLRLVPVARQNIDAVDGVLSRSVPALEAAAQLRRTAEELAGGRLLADRRVDLEKLPALRAQVAGAVAPISRLERELEAALNGWVVPPLWEEFDDLEKRTARIHDSLVQAADLLSVAPSMLGAEGRRTYLVLLLNNAELRGAGGLMTGVGRLSIADGRFSIGPFSYYGDLPGRSERTRVRAPREYARRFGRVDANTTLYANVSYSPNVSDVALVAARLYRVTTGLSVDGVLVADPRGIAALVPEESRLQTPGGQTVDYRQLPRFVYSTSYETLGGASSQSRRREAIIDLGRQAFSSFLSEGPRGPSSLERIAEAAGGGHLRVVSFHGDEAGALDGHGFSGTLPEGTADSLLVTVQNVGADKLDYWMSREVEHHCDVRTRPARCATRVTLANRAPRRLPSYVAPRPGANTRQYLEVYVPERADLVRFEVDGEPAEHFDEPMAGRVSMGLELNIARGEQSVVLVSYYLPLRSNRYELSAVPQPLARDATVTLSVRTPRDWVTRIGVDESGTYSGPFNGTVRVVAEPYNRPGISGAWHRLMRFLEEPVL